MVVDGNHKLFLARESYIAAGVGILVHERHAEVTSNFTQYCGRFCYVDLKFYHSKIKIFSIYAPHSGFHFSEFDQLMHRTMDLITSAHSDSFICIVNYKISHLKILKS